MSKPDSQGRGAYDPKAIPPEIAELRAHMAEWQRKQRSSWQYRTTAPDWELHGNDSVDYEKLKNWMADMVDWGKRVRRDILRLEAAAGLSEGDPGDPPPSPL